MEDSIRVRSENCGGGAKIGDNSFTALLELPPNQAVQLLVHEPYCPPPPPIIFPSDTALIDRASKFSVFAAAAAGKLTADTSSFPSNSSLKSEFVKREPVDNDDSESNPTVSLKRKEHEKKGKESSSKKSKKSANDTTEDGENLPYVHVRARRGQATDSHSLAERARREKINARMKLLQELVPGCNKISGTAMVLDEIINHVQTLQRQVEFLSMRLAAVNPRIDFNLDSLFAAESGSAVESNFTGIVVPPTWPEGQSSGNRNHYQQLLQIDGFNQPVWIREDDSRLITPENSLLTYDSSANSASLHQNQLKMELQM